MRLAFIVLLSLLSLQTVAQNNVLVERSYWKQAPSLEKVKADIAAGNDPSAFNEHTFDAVTWAILEDASDAIIWYLLEQPGNDVNKRSHDGRTPIFWAAYKDNIELMNALVAKGAKTDLIDSHGYGLVTFAASTGQTNQAIYELCIKHGATIKKEQNKDGANPLLLIIPYAKDTEIINYFKDLGISMHATDNEGNNAFTYAARSGNIDMMDYAMQSKLNPHANNDAAILFAAKGTRGDKVSLETFKYLEGKGLSLTAKDKNDRSALYYLSAKSNDIRLLQYFLQAGLKPDQKDKQGNCALLQAAAYNTGEVLHLLAKSSTNPMITNEQGESIVHLAVSNQNMETLNTALTELGMPVNETTNEGLTPLHLAAMQAKDTKMLQFLLDHGADKTIETEFGETAYDLAIENELLQKNNVNLDFLKP